LVIDEELSSIRFGLPNVASGVYFVQLINAAKGKVYTEKLVIQ